MDAQDRTTHTTHSGHGGHGVHLCRRCGWPFPNPHPSSKHRRAHKKICGTIEGYTNLIGSEVVSDDEHHADDDKEKHPSSKIDKKMSMESDGDGEIRGSLGRSEDEVFADAVTEFADSGSSGGSVSKTLDRDLFFSFKDAENADTNEVSNAPIVDTRIEVTEKTDPRLETIEETEIKAVSDLSESNLELTGTGDLVKDGVVGSPPEPSHVSQSQEAQSLDVIEAGVEKGQESQTSETITNEAKDSEITKTTPEVPVIVGGHQDNVKQENLEKLELATTYGISEEIQQEIKDSEITKMTPEVAAIVGGHQDNVKQENFEKLESVAKDGTTEEIKQEIKSETVKESETVEEIKIEKSELDLEIAPEVVTGSEMDHLWGTAEEIEHQKIESDYEHVPEVTKESKADQNVSVLNEQVDLGARNEQIQEVFKEPVAVLTEKTDFDAPQLERSSREPIQEAVEVPVAALTQKEDLGGPQLEKQPNEHTHEVVENPDSVLTEKQDLGAPKLEGSSKEQIQEVVKEPGTVLTEKEDLGGPHLEKQLNEHTHEVVENPDSVLTEKQDLGAHELEKCTKENILLEPDSVLTEKEDLGARKSEECSKDVVLEQKVDHDHNLVADVSAEMDTLNDSSGSSVTNSKNASDVVPEPVVEEGNGKLVNNQVSGADLTVDSSSHNSLEGNWGSVSVLSTASLDAETINSTEKSKVNSGKSNAATSDFSEPPSFMTLVEPESKDQKRGSSEPQDSQLQPNSEPSQAGWFPTLTNVNNESEGRKRNEEAMAKVANWTTGKQSTPLKNLLGEARSPSGKQPMPVVQKDEAVVNPPVNDEVSSPPKLIEDGKDGRKKVKGRSSWVPFVCCSSVNVK